MTTDISESIEEQVNDALREFALYMTFSYFKIAKAVTCAPCHGFTLTYHYPMDGSAPTVKIDIEHFAKVREEQGIQI